MRPGTNEAKRLSVLEDWYRERLKEAVPPLLAKWAFHRTELNRLPVRHEDWGY